MSWEQDLVDSQMLINRAVFEMNKRGRVKPEPVRPEYILEQIKEAAKSLNSAIKILSNELPFE